MSQSAHSEAPDRARTFKFTRSPWSAPLLAFLFVAGLRFFFPVTLDRLEFAWYDAALRFRAKDKQEEVIRDRLKSEGVKEPKVELGFDKPLDDRIRFVELGMDEEIARRFAEDGEYATAAGIVETISKLGASVIALDIVYAYGKEEDQKLLADTIRRINNEGGTRIVLPGIIEQDPETGEPFILRSIPRAGGEEFAQGLVNVEIDSDHLWRRYQYTNVVNGETIPSLALAAFAASVAKPLAPKVVEGQPGVMKWRASGEDGIETFTVDDRSFYLNLQHSYYKPEKYRVLTLEDLETLAEEKRKDLFYDRIVFFGYGAEFDGKPTPHGPQQPGMVLHGTALNDLLNRTAIHRLPLWQVLLVYFGIAVLAGLCFGQVGKKTWLTIGATMVLVLLGIGGWLLIWFGHLFVPTVGASLVWALSVFGEVGRRWAHEQRERTQRDAMLGFYFSPAVLKQVTQDLDMIRPQGNEVAILLSDLRGFTTLCETQKVERVFELLNRLFGVETEAALAENGSLARFAGDQFLAYWGAPEGCEDAADRALRAAMNIQETLIARREAAPEDDLDAWLQIGVGLHFGRGLVGHVGSRDYRDYNIVGDSVNTTARVEGQTKNYAAPILATGEFMNSLSEPPPSLKVDHVRVKGRHKSVEMFAISIPGREPDSKENSAYGEAFSSYERGDFSEAAKLFSALKESEHPTVATSASLLEQRCLEFASESPADWDGVFVLTDK